MLNLKSVVRETFPGAWQRARVLRQSVQLVPRLFGRHRRECTLCGYEGKFLAEIHFPDIFFYDAICPRCGSQPRHRLLALAISEKGLIGPADRILHFAPEYCVSPKIRPLGAEYVTADLDPRGVDTQQDIERLTFEDRRWDVIICSHVLEHVDHDRALPELFRVLGGNGRLLALFPIVEGWQRNYENPEVKSPYDRALHFGKDNHRRRFGREVREAFRAAGFRLEEYSPCGEQAVRYGLIPGETLFIGWRD